MGEWSFIVRPAHGTLQAQASVLSSRKRENTNLPKERVFHFCKPEGEKRGNVSSFLNALTHMPLS